MNFGSRVAPVVESIKLKRFGVLGSGMFAARQGFVLWSCCCKEFAAKILVQQLN